MTDSVLTDRWTIAIAAGQVWREQMPHRVGMESRGTQRRRARIEAADTLVAVLRVYQAHGAEWVDIRTVPPLHPWPKKRPKRSLLVTEFRSRFAPCGVTRLELVS